MLRLYKDSEVYLDSMTSLRLFETFVIVYFFFDGLKLIISHMTGAAKRVSHLLKMHTSGSSSEKKGGISSIFSATANATGGDSTIISEGSGSPDSPIKHGVKELSIEDDTESKVKEVGKTQSETKANDPFGFGWW